MARFQKGQIVRTSYGTGPYVIMSIYGPSTEPSFVSSLNGDNTPSKPHFYLTVRPIGVKGNSDCYLNGYDENGNSVWNNDRLIFCSEETTLLTLAASM